MAVAFQPPPTYASPVLVDERTKQSQFNPIWLKWFLDLAAFLTASGGGSGGAAAHNDLSGLQGGSLTERFHITASQAADLPVYPITIAKGGTGVSLTDPNADRILFWDDSAGAFTFLTAGSGLTITGTTITSSGSAHVIQDEGTPLTQRPALNFKGAGVTASDNAGTNATDVTIPGGASPASGDPIQGALATDSGDSTSSLTPVQLNTPRGFTPESATSTILVEVSFQGAITGVTATNTLGSLQLFDVENAVDIGELYFIESTPTTAGAGFSGPFVIRAIVENTVLTARSFYLRGFVNDAAAVLSVSGCVFSFMEYEGTLI